VRRSGTRLAFYSGTMNAEHKKILVVDDEQHQRDTICRGLFIQGYQCHCVADIEQARAALTTHAGHHFALLLTDLTMHANAGLAVIRMARRQRPDLPVIAVTGLSTDKATAVVRDLGIPMLQKPFEPDALDRAIRAALSSKIDQLP
jgi:DNA-binding response OmpR family regulator